MAIDWGERPRQSGVMQFRNPSAKRDYWVSGASTKLDAQLTILAASPAIELLLDAQGNTINLFRKRVEANEIGGGAWDVIVNYEASTNTVEFSVQLGVKSGKIFEALETTLGYSLDGTGDIPDIGTTIGWNGEEVEGTEVEVSDFQIVITKKFEAAILSSGYITLLTTFLRPRTAVNDAVFNYSWNGQVFSFPKGSLRARGFPIKQNSDGELEISYHLHYDGGIVDADNFTIRDSANITKEGHEIISIHYEPEVAGGRMVKKPKAAYVQRVYPYKKFADLAL